MIEDKTVQLRMYVWSALSAQSGDRSGKVANPARGQLNRENVFSLCPRSRWKNWFHETVSTVPSRVSLFILCTP